MKPATGTVSGQAVWKGVCSMADETLNKDHRIINELSEKINRAGDLKEEIEDLTVKREKYRNVKFSSEHKFFPYGALMLELDEDVRKRTFGKSFFLFLYLLLTYAALFALPAAAVFVMDYLELFAYSRFLEELVFTIMIIGAYAVVVAVFLLTFKKHRWRLIRGLEKRKRKRLIKKRKEKLGNAMDESRRMIKEYEAAFAEKIEDADERMKKAQEELSALEKEFAQNATVPLKFIPEIRRVKSYFDEKRADTIKEALNLLVAEKREEERFNHLMAMLKKHLSSLEHLGEEFASVQQYQKTLAERSLREDREKEREAKMQKSAEELPREGKNQKKSKKEKQKHIKRKYY